MGQKVVVGPFNKGFTNNVTPFNIDDDSFPTLINAYQWRGRVKRKRGTQLLCRLTRFFDSTVGSYGSVTTITLSGTGAGNVLSGAFGITTLAPNSALVPGSVVITQGVNVYTDQGDGTFLPSGTLNYATGAILIAAEAGNAVNAKFRYYPDLPVMGLEEFVLITEAFPGVIGFDTKYSYAIKTNVPYNSYDVSFYKNIAVSATLPGYVPKTTWTPTTWNGQDYQQFWTVNYQGALWATNGINVPFSTTNIGMQYNTITAVAIVAGTPAFATFTTTTNHGLVIGDFVFINEVVDVTGMNFQTGYVTAVPALNQITVEFPYASFGGAWTSGGIVQYLTNRSDTTKDCLRWYDGDPTNGNATVPGFTQGKGWVNFAPPLSQDVYSIADLPPAQYYLVGARMIVAFKDRLLFLGPVVQTSSANSQVYLQDTVIYSQNGTPYYTCSFKASTNYPLPPVTTPPGYAELLVPVNQTATPSAYFEDQTGFGGFITAGVDQPIITASSNEDLLIIGFRDLQSRLVYTGNDITPFNFFTVNSEYGSGSTFSAINMDAGVLSKGEKGYIITSQTQVNRIDLSIPDQVFETSLINNGLERVCAQRDFIKEWIYFTYPSNQITYKFPNQTLQYNYRDSSWAIFNECYTTYGIFRPKTGYTWADIGTEVAETWSEWNDPWNSGSSTLLQQQVIAGNQQGFVMIRDAGTGEGTSLFISNISGNTITSPSHCLNEGDYIIISGVQGTTASLVNGKIFSVGVVITDDTFTLNPSIVAGTYLGGGLITRMYVPYIQTKQFPLAWDSARKTRIGPQQYLLSRTNNAQITLLIFLSQDSSNAYNESPIIPAPGSVNDSLIYSTVLYTCPESTNLGLTAANTNLQQLTSLSSSGVASNNQSQIWHRINTSLIGDTIQMGFTMSDTQMRTVTETGIPICQFAEIEIHGIVIDASPSMVLS